MSNLKTLTFSTKNGRVLFFILSSGYIGPVFFLSNLERKSTEKRNICKKRVIFLFNSKTLFFILKKNLSN